LFFYYNEEKRKKEKEKKIIKKFDILTIMGQSFYRELVEPVPEHMEQMKQMKSNNEESAKYKKQMKQIERCNCSICFGTGKMFLGYQQLTCIWCY
jgi:hypothetical protein